jgi:hypothetical protein
MVPHVMPSASSRSTAPVSAIDPFSPAFLADPYPFHAELRDAGPVVRLSTYNIYAVARYDDVARVLGDFRTFCSGRGVGMGDFAREKPWRPPSLVLEKDPPEHDRARNVLNKVLSPAVLRALREGFTQAAEKKASELIERKEFDAIAELAEGFPLAVFPDAVGLRSEGREHLLPYAGTVFNAFGPDNDLRRAAIARAAPHVAWVAEQCRRENLSRNGLGAKVYEAADAGEITADEAMLLVRSLLSAGIDTTVASFAAAIHCLARTPSQWQRLRAEPALARAAFEEAIRLESPVQTFFRTTTTAAQFGEVTIGEGEKVLMLLASANRDPRKWDRPDEYIIERGAGGHVGFGAGIHMCVGQLLARLEGQVMLAALASRAKTIELTAEPRRAFNNTLRSLATLPVRVTAN